MAAKPRTGVQVVGLSRTITQMRKLGVDAADLKEAWEPLGYQAVGVAMSLTPQRTGKLARSVRASRKQNGVTVRVGNARAPYAVYPHFGTTYQPPQEWMFRTLRSLDVDGEVARAIQSAILKAGLAR